MIRGLAYAIGFLTRIPVPGSVFTDMRARQASVAWYPLVGALLGALLAGLSELLRWHNPALVAALVLIAWVALTGGLHLDGLADSADAWIGGLGDRERTLAIMKDPRCGPAALAAVTLLLLTKFAALQALPAPGRALALGLAPMLGRTALTALLLSTPYVRTQGIATGLADRGIGPWLALALALGLCVSCGINGLAAGLAAAVVFWLWRRAGLRRLGGYTGDTAGALAEMVELVVLIVIGLRLD